MLAGVVVSWATIGYAAAQPDTTVVNPPPVTVTATPAPITVTYPAPPPPVTTTATVTAPPPPPVTTTVTAPPVTSTVTVTPPTTPPPAPCGGPINITAGGTYSGCYQSTNAGTPAVTISTTAPVTLSKARIIAKGNGVVGNANYNLAGIQLTVVDSTFEQTDPGAVVEHRAVRLFLPGSFTFLNNKLTNTDGVWLAGIDGNPSAMSKLVVNNNLAINIGRYPHPTGSTGCCVQFLQLSSINLTNGGQVWWNQTQNTAGQSEVEDNISFYHSGGIDSTHRVDIAYNLIDGGYSRSLAVTNYTGGGINLGDGGGGSGFGGSGHNTAHDNTLVSLTNYGISVNGPDNYANNNLLVNDGVEQKSEFGQAIVAWPEVSPGGIHSTNARVNWKGRVGDLNGQYPCYVATYCQWTTVATTEQQARDAWQASRAAAGVVVGPRP